MKKVLMVSCEGLGNGGVQNVMMNIVRNLKNKYLIDMLLFTNDRRYYDDEFERIAGHIYRIPNYNGNNLLRKKIDYYIRGGVLYKEVYRILSNNGPYAVVHCNNNYEGAIILKAAKAAGVNVRIMHSHVIHQKGNFIVNRLNAVRKREISKFATKQIACSIEAAKSFYDARSEFCVVKNPFDDNIFHCLSPLQLQRPLELVQIGAFSDNKNQLYSAKVLLEIKKLYNNVKLNYIGFELENGYIEKVRCFIHENGLDENVVFYKSDADRPQILDSSAFLIHPSKNEGFGIVVIEAQAVGNVCFVSDSLPKEVNCGGCKFFSLNEKPSLVANMIIDEYKKDHGKHFLFDCNEFTSSTFINTVEDLYKGL